MLAKRWLAPCGSARSRWSDTSVASGGSSLASSAASTSSIIARTCLPQRACRDTPRTTTRDLPRSRPRARTLAGPVEATTPARAQRGGTAALPARPTSRPAIARATRHGSPGPEQDVAVAIPIRTGMPDHPRPSELSRRRASDRRPRRRGASTERTESGKAPDVSGITHHGLLVDTATSLGAQPPPGLVEA